MGEAKRSNPKRAGRRRGTNARDRPDPKRPVTDGVVGRRVSDLAHPEDGHRLLSALVAARAVDEHAREPVVWQLRDTGRGRRYMETMISDRLDDPDVRALVLHTREITEHQDFNWWMPQGTQLDPVTAQALQQANDAVVESHRVDTDIPGAVWWVNPGGGKAHIRWVRPDDNEDGLLNALARVAARGELHLGEGTKFAGVFRTHGIIVPVFDLDPGVSHDSYGAELDRVSEAVSAEVSSDAQLSADERKQLQNIKSRQVTIR